MAEFNNALLKLKKIWRKHGRSILVPCFIFLIVFTVYYLTKPGSTPYNSYVRLADTFLHGRLHLTENLPWLELAPVGDKFYIVPPPMPALLILPLVAVKGLLLDQTLISIILGSLCSVILYSLMKKIFAKHGKKSATLALWTTALFSFGTIFWYLSSVGSVWYFGQVVAIFFLLLSLNELFGKKRAWLVGLFLGAAFWSRLPVILSLPFFILILLKWGGKEKKWRKLFNKNNFSLAIQFSLGVGFFIILNFIYNYIRFETIFDASYHLIPGIMDEYWYRNGLFSLSYIPDGLKILFLQGPIVLKQFPYIQPSWFGMAIWMTTPAFIFALNSPKDKTTLACWSAIVPIAILVLSHGCTGFTQFGYRFAMDFYPFLIILTARGVASKNYTLKWYHLLLVGISIIVNLWGVLWINIFGWVGWW